MAKVRELHHYMAQGLAECFGTFILILMGESAIAQYKFSGHQNHSTITINLSFGIAVYTALMVAGPISGAHINPAVSISLLTVRKLKPVQCLIYIIGQLVGAFFGGLVVYYLYWSLFNEFDGGVRHVSGTVGTADIFFTMPAKGVPQWNSFFDQIVGTALLMIFIMAVIDEHNHMISDVARPFSFVLVIVGITSAFAGNAGGAINPARDFGPRLFASFVYGWRRVFQANDYFFWVPIVGPILGAIIGVWVYEGYSLLVRRFSNTHNSISIELHPKVRSIDDDNQAMISHELTTVRS